MKYTGLFLALALATAGTAYAESEDDTANPRGKATAKSALESEYRVECIETGLSDDLEDDQLNQFVEQCVAAKIAGKSPAA